MPLSALLRRSALIAFFAATALVLYMALRPVPDTPGGIWDKAQHFIAFYVLAGLGALGFAKRSTWLLAVGLVVLGALIEILQGTPLIHRDAEFFDLVADTLGVGAALCPMLLPTLRAWLGRD